MHNAVTSLINQVITTLGNAMNATSTSRSQITPQLITQLAKHIHRLATSTKIPIDESIPNMTPQLTEQIVKQLTQLHNIAMQRDLPEQTLLFALLSAALLISTIPLLNSPQSPENPP